jgi:hypothetical protein
MSRNILGEFMEFFIKGLYPFKIQTKFNIVWLPKFLIPLMLGILTYSQKESCSFSNFWTPGRLCFVFSKFVHLKSIGNPMNKWKRVFIRGSGLAH